jgi:hypothetical protein
VEYLEVDGRPRFDPVERVGHWYDHALGSLWMLGHAPAPEPPCWTHEQVCILLEPTAWTLRYLSREYDNPAAESAAAALYTVMDAFRDHGAEAGVETAKATAQELEARLISGKFA